MWDERYATDDYIFGTEPAAFLVRAAPMIPPGSRVLCLAEGEGRNGVWLAGQGHRVTGIDQSAVGLAKAARLAATRGVTLTLRQADVMAWDGSDGPWDAVVAIFVHFHVPERERLAAACARALRPGGLFLYHGYGPAQLALGTGGPRDPAMLAEAEAMVAAFPGWGVRVARDHEDMLAEGSRHVGRSALVDVILTAPGVDARAPQG
ncbi:MAG: class I SAM-dependent methyltransferase [Paracoccaceae bacterium]|nr:MAG: class I SAM-dependent methyltransferase [Paracoccaceae bacterium]